MSENETSCPAAAEYYEWHQRRDADQCERPCHEGVEFQDMREKYGSHEMVSSEWQQTDENAEP